MEKKINNEENKKYLWFMKFLIMPEYDLSKNIVEIPCSAKIRSLSEPKKGKLIKQSSSYSFEFDEPAEAITRGQACVLYDNDRVLGGGIIKQKLN